MKNKITLGMKNKITLGPWFRHAFRLLYAMRRLRGTRLDLFGHAEVRRVERQLIVDYKLVVTQMLASLSEVSIDHAVAVAELPDMIRGYENVKLRNVDDYRRKLQELMGSSYDRGMMGVGDS